MTETTRPATVAEVLAGVIDTATTIADDPGAFGAALGLLGFGEGRRRPANFGGECWTFDHPAGRVICYPEDGDRVVVVGWDRARPAAQLEAFRMEFTGGTPSAAVVLALGTITA